MLPGKFEKKTIFVTTGAEAVENAIKIARNATGRQAVIAFAGGFHGRTFMGMALTGKVVPYKVGFGAMPGDVFHAPFPVPLHGVSVADSLAALDRLFKADVDPARVAAIILEPVQGEGGFYEAPRDLMTALRKICDQHGILLIADEVQTGFARTGKMFAMDHHEVAPDITTMAKSLAGGWTYCVQVRARNRVGQLSAWTGGRCLTRALDDRRLAASSGWKTRTGDRYYQGTFRTTKQQGATLSRSGARVRRVGVVATTCPGCGR